MVEKASKRLPLIDNRHRLLHEEVTETEEEEVGREVRPATMQLSSPCGKTASEVADEDASILCQVMISIEMDGSLPSFSVMQTNNDGWNVSKLCRATTDATVDEVRRPTPGLSSLTASPFGRTNSTTHTLHSGSSHNNTIAPSTRTLAR